MADLASTMGNLQNMAALARQLNMAASGGMGQMGNMGAPGAGAGNLMANLGASMGTPQVSIVGLHCL